MKKQLLVTLLGTALALPLVAQAEGAYVGFNVGRAENKYSVDGESAKENGTGFKLYAGYDFSQNFGVEAGFARLAKNSESNEFGSFSYKPTALYVAGKGTLPLNDQFSLFAKVGLSANRAKASCAFPDGTSASDTSDKTSAVFGVGAAYNFTKNISLVAEYENFGKTAEEQGSSVKSDMLSLGLRYKF